MRNINLCCFFLTLSALKRNKQTCHEPWVFSTKYKTWPIKCIYISLTVVSYYCPVYNNYGTLLYNYGSLFNKVHHKHCSYFDNFNIVRKFNINISCWLDCNFRSSIWCHSRGLPKYFVILTWVIWLNVLIM